jgi:hypothetical protein
MAHEVAIGGRLMPALLFSGFQRSLRTLLILGAMNMAAMAAAFACTFPIDGGILMGLAATAPDLQHDLCVLRECVGAREEWDRPIGPGKATEADLRIDALDKVLTDHRTSVSRRRPRCWTTTPSW